MSRITSLDLADMTVAADFWIMSMNEQAAWEAMRLECQAEQEARKEMKP